MGTKANASDLTWNKISGKPVSYTPSSHTHDDRYYTESETETFLQSKMRVCQNEFSSTYDFCKFLEDSPAYTASGRLKDTTGWGPFGDSGNWYRFWAALQNPINSEHSIGGQAIFSSGKNAWLGYFEKNDSSIIANWTPLRQAYRYTEGTQNGGVKYNFWSTGSTVTVEVEGGLNQNVSAWGSLQIGVLPSVCRPPMTLVFPVAGIAGGQYGLTIQINTSGSIQIVNRSNQTVTGDNKEIFTICTFARELY